MDMNLFSRMTEIFWIEKEKKHLWFFSAYKYILCDGTNSYVDAKERNQIQGFLSVLQTGMAFQQVQSWTRVRAGILYLSYFIVGQGKECKYVYFHIFILISVMFQEIM